MQTFRQRVRTIVFESGTRAGRAFVAAVIGCVLASVVAVVLDSIPAVHRAHADVLYGIEWFFTILFTIEYAVRKREINPASPRCTAEGHSSQAAFCWRCGSPLHPEPS